MKKYDILVVGGGAAGMIAAINAKSINNNVILIEKNNKLGKKIAITGKGRCNITTNLDVEDIIKNIVCNAKFMYTSLYSFTNLDVVDFFERNGLQTKVERGNRIFPVSDRAKDVVSTLEKVMDEKDIEIKLNTNCRKIEKVQGEFIIYTDNETLKANKLIVATGGLSYASTGSDGYGLKVAKSLGHNIKKTYPVLTSFIVDAKKSGFSEAEYKSLAGLSLKNVSLFIYDGKKKIYDEFGEMLFTHKGISGPIVLTATSKITGKYNYPLDVYIDLKPALNVEKLEQRLIREFDEGINKDLVNVMKNILPIKLIDKVLKKAEIDPRKKVNQVTKLDRSNLIETIKKFKLTISGNGGYKEAVVTRGGVDVKEVDAYTMESKLVDGLYFAGEMLDIDALTGGFNLQIAWSTGYLAGLSARVCEV